LREGRGKGMSKKGGDVGGRTAQGVVQIRGRGGGEGRLRGRGGRKGDEERQDMREGGKM